MNNSTTIKNALKKIDSSVCVTTKKGSSHGWIEIRTTLSREIVRDTIEQLKKNKHISLRYDEDDNGRRSDWLSILSA